MAEKISCTDTGKNLTMLIALLPLTVYSVMNSSLCSLVTIAVSVASCVVFEALIQKLLKQKIQIKDLSAASTGLILALILPAQIAVWQVVLGALVAVVVAKAFFGGNGNYVFSPALIGRAFLWVSFKSAFESKWLFPHDGGKESVVALILMAVAFIYLVINKVIDWKAPLMFVSLLFSIYTLSFAANVGTGFGAEVLKAYLGGGIVFAAVFLLSDETIIPNFWAGKVIYGTGAAILTYLIAIPGANADGAMFGILIMNAVAPYLNRSAAKPAQAGGAK
ncbi:MAG: RnfABCDGE type electron transport complex subunit D [Treponema sp.]|nr:RnfABCDGE type electron transport complex subunit D [Candidatus Treponema equifaecale]